MFNFIRNRFRYKAKSIKEFAEVIKKKGCSSVIVKTYQKTRSRANKVISDEIVVSTQYRYMLRFTTITPRGRRVVCRQRLFERFRNDHASAEEKDKRNAAIKHFLLGELRVKELQMRFPNMLVNLIGPDGRFMGDEKFDKLHEDAETCGVSI